MSEYRKPNPEVQPKVERRNFTVDYKRRMIAQAEERAYGELGALLRREGITYAQINQWRKAQAEGRLGRKRGPMANPNRAELRRLEAENARLARQLAQAEAIIAAQKKLARLLEEQQS